jgi:hypothetical protein
MAPRQVTRRAVFQTEGTGVAASFCSVLPFVCNDRFALASIAVRGISPADTLAAPSH